MRIRHLKQAVADAQSEAKFWYEQEPALKEEFVKELAASIEMINRSPDAFVQVSQKLRRFHERRFYTQILYEYLPEENLIQIMHE